MGCKDMTSFSRCSLISFSKLSLFASSSSYHNSMIHFRDFQQLRCRAAIHKVSLVVPLRRSKVGLMPL
jgi:hypothetical protein